MQIILMEKVINLGSLGDVVNVKNGYARNFLIPQGKAKRATTANMAEFEVRRAEIIAADKAKLADAQARGEKLAGTTVQISQKAGVDGRLFGSVTNADIAQALVASGFEVDKAQVRTADGHLKSVGDYTVSIQLHTDVTVEITVSVLGEH
ncbi:MAG TPA: 50S ribosomal protein L9 [Gallionella sp.]|jgi:large subunit ribosomal protein L9|nr:50S ribosomal protein L9 [Gallionella sp.]OGS67313.1 MAG: 50S ribosomal protein L9 [Gallionellales bacterium GWA2_54_124]OGT18002.1 MAG: 50S ribosomal protein L9 [Gallionellales bacterium RIFOXYD12_FULL_53_10]HCI52123.1 50S ribosomal protein L9 [Gallionella sp.]